VYSDNEKSIRFVKNMGFVEEARLSDCQPNGDIIFLTLKRVDCRFLEDRYGNKDTEATANN
jgi:RimJ/RimL family protein N-acetyltransferase